MPNPNHEDKESLIEPLEGLLIDLDFTLYYTKDLVYGGGSEYVLANQHLKDKFQQALTLATERAVKVERDRIKKNLTDIPFDNNCAQCTVNRSGIKNFLSQLTK